MEDSQCRTCLGEALDLRLSIDRQVNGVAVTEMLEKLTQINVSKDEMFSKTVCKKCFHDICNAFSFRTKFLDTERTLRGFEKKLLSLQCRSEVIKQETIYFSTDIESPKIEHEEYEIIDEGEEKISHQPQQYMLELEDATEQNEIVTYEEEEEEGDEPDEVEFVEYEQVEYLEGDNHNENNDDLIGYKKEDSVTKKVSYFCIECSESFKTEFGVQHHSYFFHLKGPNPTICENCNIEFPIKDLDDEEEIARNIAIHNAYHSQGKIHSCVDCFLVFKTIKQLETHKKSIHNFPSASYPRCKHCNSNFFSVEQLNKHMEESKCKHIPEKHFKCYICNEIFSMGIAKKKHIQEAHKDKIGQDCPLCLRCKIPSAVAYENHYKTHFVAPRFSCNFCSKSFYESDRLQMHIRRFHDRRRYICFFCNKDFRDKSGIARHIMGVHFNARNFKCGICSKAFTASYNLKEHMFAIHKMASTIYNCDLCSQDYLYRKQFERHRESCQGVPEKRKR